VQGNVIAFNGEDGVSTSRSRISLLDNVIAHNRTQIDMGLDGPTPDFQDQSAAQPVITSARFDAGGKQTIVEGTVRRRNHVYGETAMVYIYANAGDAEGGEQFIGTAVADETGHFMMMVPRDLRGTFIDATAFVIIDYGDYIVRVSSEFGPSVPVT
jgi:hypothetical protein